MMADPGEDAKEQGRRAAKAARLKAAVHEAEARIAIRKGVESGPQQRRRTVSVTRQSPYGNGVETVEMCIGTDPLEHLAHRRHITVPQKQAGDKFRRAYIAASGSAGLGIDYTRERVDTSGAGDPISQSVVDGMRVLQSAINVLGRIDYEIMTALAGESMPIADYARKVNGRLTNERDCKDVGKRFKEGLLALAVKWGFERAEKAKSRVHRWQAEESGETYPERAHAPYVHPANKRR